ncbi:MAG: hypothetical protein FWC47_02690 [Oscillospiraceae bacterium]|nr:hypothetical protein [Oscillospiraceae bacterium]
MKKKKIIIVLVIIILFLSSFFIIKYSSWSNTLNDALSKSHPNNLNIIYKEITKEGLIVFYQQFNGKDLSIAFVKNELSRYKVSYSGTQGDIDTMLNKFGFTFMFFPHKNGVFFPVYLGIISNPEIVQIKVSDKNGKIIKDAKINNLKNYRVWTLDMSDFKETEVYITAYSDNKTEIIKIEDTVVY